MGEDQARTALYLGVFPLEFVDEVKNQLGVEFFISIGSGFEVCPKEIFKKDRSQAYRFNAPLLFIEVPTEEGGNECLL